MELTKTVNDNQPDVASLIDAHSTMLYRFYRSLTYTKEDAEDLFQETWITVLRNPNILQEAAIAKSILCKSTLYLWKSRQRKYARRNRIAPEQPLDFEIADNQSLEEEYLGKAEKELVQSLVNELPEKFRTPLVLYYTLEMSVAEIAKTLEISPGTVKSRLFYARQEIKKGWLEHE